jgi:hypothetical protein
MLNFPTRKALLAKDPVQQSTFAIDKMLERNAPRTEIKEETILSTWDLCINISGQYDAPKVEYEPCGENELRRAQRD